MMHNILKIFLIFGCTTFIAAELAAVDLSAQRPSLPLAEYLPPVQEPTINAVPSLNAIDANGYRYRTVRRLKFRARHRRDVNELIAPPPLAPLNVEYLPPVAVELAPDLRTLLGDDGYRYKTVRRLKYRRHRREVVESENEATTPAVAAEEPIAEESATEPIQLAKAETVEAAEHRANDEAATDVNEKGYRYKTVRRIKYRYRN